MLFVLNSFKAYVGRSGFRTFNMSKLCGMILQFLFTYLNFNTDILAVDSVSAKCSKVIVTLT